MRTLNEIAADLLFNEHAETVAAEFGWPYDLAVEYAAEKYNAAWDEALAYGHTESQIYRAMRSNRKVCRDDLDHRYRVETDEVGDDWEVCTICGHQEPRFVPMEHYG